MAVVRIVVDILVIVADIMLIAMILRRWKSERRREHPPYEGSRRINAGVCGGAGRSYTGNAVPDRAGDEKPVPPARRGDSKNTELQSGEPADGRWFISLT